MARPAVLNVSDGTDVAVASYPGFSWLYLSTLKLYRHRLVSPKRFSKAHILVGGGSLDTLLDTVGWLRSDTVIGVECKRTMAISSTIGKLFAVVSFICGQVCQGFQLWIR